MALKSSLPTIAQIKLCTPENRIQRLECVTDTSNKYYEVYVVETPKNSYRLFTRHGKIGTSGVVTIKGEPFNQSTVMLNAGILVGTKAKKGYQAVNIGKKSSNVILEETSKKTSKSKKVVAKVSFDKSLDRLNNIDFD